MNKRPKLPNEKNDLRQERCEMNAHERSGTQFLAVPLQQMPTLRGYLNRVTATARSFRKFVVEAEGEGNYGNVRRVTATISIDTQKGQLSIQGAVDPPLPQEVEAIRLEIIGASWPRSTAARRGQLPVELNAVSAEDIFEFATHDGNETTFVQQRRVDDAGTKSYLPWSFWNDGVWRQMEPDDLLPLYGLDRLEEYPTVYLHEGAKAARAAQRIADGANSPASAHPWRAELIGCHLGWIGGAKNSHRTDWLPLSKTARNRKIVIVADNDQFGIDAVSAISRILRTTMSAVIFDDRFPSGFDIADDLPKAFWRRNGRYRGPSLEDFTVPATWATDKVTSQTKKGGHSYCLRDEFADEWLMSQDPHLIAHRQQLDRLLAPEVFNRSVSPFSDARDTAQLLAKRFSSHADGILYRPNRDSLRHRLINEGGRRLVNTFRPSDIRPNSASSGPFEEYAAHLFPDETDRIEALRWCATLIARPEIRMRYAMLLISEAQGIGKTTLAEAILAPLVGHWNASFPTEQQVTESSFNSWVAHKRLAIVAEIYSGQTRKAYDRFKSVISDSTVDVNRKYVEPYTVENWLHVIASSNSLHAIRIDDGDRRWLVPQVAEDPKPAAWWQSFYAWLSSEGLGAIAAWAERYVTLHGAVLTGDHAPHTARKRDVVAESRSEGQRMTYDLGCLAMARKDLEKIVLRVDEVREWVAAQRGLALNDHRVERQLTLRKILRFAGLTEPELIAGKSDRRMMIEGRYREVVANFELGGQITWDKIKAHHKKPGDVIPI
jgi:Family of unknown function (DUF5906)